MPYFIENDNVSFLGLIKNESQKWVYFKGMRDFEDYQADIELAQHLFAKRANNYKVFPDLMFITVPIISRDFYECLPDFNHDFKFIKTSIVSLEDEIQSEHYFALVTPYEYEILDHDNAEFEYSEKAKAYFGVTKWAVSEQKIPELDYFRTHDNMYIISDKLHRHLMQKKLKGIKYTKVELSS